MSGATREHEVVCGGEILWDFFEAGHGKYCRFTGGASANAAISLARLGIDVALVGKVGAGVLGDLLLEEIGRDGVDVTGVIRSKGPTGIVIKTSGRFAAYRRDETVRGGTARARWALVGSMKPRVVGLRARNIAVDLNVRPSLWASKSALRTAATELVRRADVIKASDHDLERLCGSEARGLTWLRRVRPRAIVLVTRAAEPASAIGPFGRVDVPALRCVARESTGGGDAFMAGALAVVVRAGAAWNRPEVLTAALQLGHRLGKKAVSRTGAVTGLTKLESIRWP